MKRRDFFKNTSMATVAAGIGLSSANAKDKKGQITDSKKRQKDNWYQVGNGKKGIPSREKTVTYDVVVVGAGIAGICAAVSSARMGAKTLLVNDRPVLGGNASSEIRVTLNGVKGLKRKNRTERETGIVEELLIENWHYNPQESYPVWDHVVYDFVTREENLDVMLNTQAIDAQTKKDKITDILCWQSTTETYYTIKADVFCDCSGDGLMAAQAGAEYRTGREGKAEFDESFAPDKADGWQMGATVMMITKDMGKPVKYNAPKFTIPYEADKMHDRGIKNFKEGYWWVELGSEFDIIEDFEENRHKLLGYMHGVWDYVKNSGKFPEAENIALDWVGSFPGRRESRRFMGDHILSQKDMQDNIQFEDAVAYGGWSFDEHCPGGIESPNEPPSYFHARFKEVYQVPFRSLYSKNISNLMFAGRNVSVTHVALSSTRIMATCGLMGQAIGTAAQICVDKKWTPRELANKNINLLQEQLLRDDVYIPRRAAQDENDLAKKASKITVSSTASGDAQYLVDGTSRDIDNKIHHWESNGLDAEVIFEWDIPVALSKIELKGNTNLHRNLMMHKNPAKNKDQINDIPPELIKNFDAQIRVNGKWQSVAKVEDNISRLIKLDFEQKKTTGMRLKLKNTWGEKNIRLYEVRCYS
ncbi:FAD-dependent oxidoreductase [Flammeovirga pacifica]|uniref:FAD-binding dehydrogenase n=1 Tax=Flammeovirga pacifica TaxID=915059 RepID=A0A1S1YY78_FLAPC|nr:FAD-dependent oxidoreductase [Flammeovirga pacifica]OHX65969.1 FAD-binding dehydrogenase [Flammeovirga pacifica]